MKETFLKKKNFPAIAYCCKGRHFIKRPISLNARLVTFRGTITDITGFGGNLEQQQESMPPYLNRKDVEAST